jgi:hypothetical protein
LNTLYSHCHDGQDQPNSEILVTTLHAMLPSFRDIYVVLDALDECKEGEELLALIKKVFGWNLALHMLVASRREKYIEDSLEPIASWQVCVRDDTTDADIRIHVRERLQNDASLKAWPVEVREEIESTLMDGAHGMYSKPFHFLRNWYPHTANINAKVSVGHMPTGRATQVPQNCNAPKNLEIVAEDFRRYIRPNPV